jgi:ribosome production factor 2
MFGFNSKKRPNSLIIGRFFDNQVLDMFEFCIKDFKPMEDFKTPKVTLGVKPVLVFHGEPFAVDPEFMRLKCLLADFFRGEVVDNIRLQGVEHVLSFTAVDGKLLFRSYR